MSAVDKSSLSPDTFRSALERCFNSEPTPPVVNFEKMGRRRLASRRSVTAGLAAASVAVVIGLAWPIATSLTGSDGSANTGATSRAGWQDIRWESAQIVFSVPADWQPGAQSQWCGSGVQSPAPYYSTPDMGGSTSMLCSSPVYWFGASVIATSELPDAGISDVPTPYQGRNGETLFPTGAWIAQVEAAPGWILLVVADSEHSASSIVSSIRHLP